MYVASYARSEFSDIATGVQDNNVRTHTYIHKANNEEQKCLYIATKQSTCCFVCYRDHTIDR